MRFKLTVLLVLFSLLSPAPGRALTAVNGNWVQDSPIRITPRGIRNANPGNLRARTENSWKMWRGATGVDDSGYLVFKRQSDGIRALAVNLLAYSRKHGIRTPQGIIRRWTKDIDEAGKVEYIRFICRQLKVGPYAKLDMEDRDVILKLTRAIISFENGQDPYPNSLYQKVFSHL